MSRYSTEASIFSGNPLEVNEANPSHELGTLLVSPDGRKYRYAKAGASALVVGNLLQGPAEDTNNQNVTGATTAIGATSITTGSAVTVTKDQYAGGYVCVTVTPGLGYLYRIKYHAAATAAVCTFYLEDPIQVALTSTSRLDFYANAYNGVIQSPTTASASIVGVAVKPITASYYGWIQVGGIAAVLNQGGTSIGLGVVRSNGTAGAVETATNASTEAQEYVGAAASAVDNGHVGFVKLNIE